MNLLLSVNLVLFLFYVIYGTLCEPVVLVGLIEGREITPKIWKFLTVCDQILSFCAWAFGPLETQAASNVRVWCIGFLNPAI